MAIFRHAGGDPTGVSFVRLPVLGCSKILFLPVVGLGGLSGVESATSVLTFYAPEVASPAIRAQAHSGHVSENAVVLQTL
jgi:hypothetical protein